MVLNFLLPLYVHRSFSVVLNVTLYGPIMNPTQSAGDIEHIIRADKFGGIAHCFDQRWKIGSDHRRAASHGLQGSESESLIERGEGEGGGGAIEHAQGFHGHEAQESHEIVDAAGDDGAADTGVFGKLVANDNQAKI